VNIMTADDIQQKLREKHLKVTPQRCAIYQMLLQTTSHPTAEEVLSNVKSLFPMISPNTVYYTLNAFEDAGLITPINDAHTRYDANLAPHHHLICLRCRNIQDIHDNNLNKLELSHKTEFKITDHRVEFYGYCRECQGHELNKTATNSVGRRKT